MGGKYKCFTQNSDLAHLFFRQKAAFNPNFSVLIIYPFRHKPKLLFGPRSKLWKCQIGLHNSHMGES